MPNYGEAARQHFEELKKLVKETDGWKKVKEQGGITLESKPMNNISIECYRATGHADKSPKELADHAVVRRNLARDVAACALSHFR